MKQQRFGPATAALLRLALGAWLVAACSSSGSSIALTVVPRTVPPITLLPATATAATPAAPASTPAAGTSPSATVAAGGSLLISTDQLIGLPVADNAGNAAGVVGDVLVDLSGTLQSLVIDLAPVDPTSTPAAGGTPALTGTPNNSAALTPVANVSRGRFVAPLWSQMTPDPANNRLVFQGTLTDLTHLPDFDESAICAGYIVPPSASGGSTGQLWRLGGALATVNLQDSQGAALGALQTVLVDLAGAHALYAVIDVSSYVSSTQPVASAPTAGAASTSTSTGTGTNGASAAGNCGANGTGSLGTPLPTPAGAQNAALILLPWARLAVEAADPASSTPVVRANLTPAALTGAPTFERGQWALWPAAAAPGWSDPLQQFWAAH